MFSNVFLDDFWVVFELVLSICFLPRPPKVCFMKVFRYIKPTKRHSFGGPGRFSTFLKSFV